jgi:hypothetical protein
MSGRDKITLGLALIARNPGSLLFLFPLLFLGLMVALVFGFFYLFIKALEIALAPLRKPTPAQIEAPTILPMKESKW